MSLMSLLGGAAGFFLTGGNPAGAALGATLGGGVDQSNAATEAANTSAAAFLGAAFLGADVEIPSITI